MTKRGLVLDRGGVIHYALRLGSSNKAGSNRVAYTLIARRNSDQPHTPDHKERV
jgi:hypothetical protein